MRVYEREREGERVENERGGGAMLLSISYNLLHHKSSPPACLLELKTSIVQKKVLMDLRNATSTSASASASTLNSVSLYPVPSGMDPDSVFKMLWC